MDNVEPPVTGPTTFSTVISVVVGVILGALVTFGVTLYNHKVERERLERERRAGHIERLMSDVGQIEAAPIAFSAAIANLLIQAQIRGGVPPDMATLMPNVTPMIEMGTLTALYLPEVEAESKEVGEAYLAVWKQVLTDLGAKAKDYRPGGPMPQIEVDKTHQARFTKSINTLRAKLVDLAKRQRN